MVSTGPIDEYLTGERPAAIEAGLALGASVLMLLDIPNEETDTQPLAKRIAKYAAGLRFEDLPAPVVHETKRRFIDSFATAVTRHESSSQHAGM